MAGEMADAWREIQAFGMRSINLERALQTMLSWKCEKNLDEEKTSSCMCFGVRSNQFEIVQFSLKFCMKFIPKMLFGKGKAILLGTSAYARDTHLVI